MSVLISKLLSVLEVQPAIVVGHSAGAAILSRMCLDQQMSPRLIVSINGAFMPFRHFAGQFFAPLSRVLVANSFVPDIFSRMVNRRSVERLLVGTGSHVNETELDCYLRLFRDKTHVRGALTMMANWDLEALLKDLPGLEVPMHLITGANDKAVAPGEAREVHAM